jgi:hypothetical protein
MSNIIGKGKGRYVTAVILVAIVLLLFVVTILNRT